MAGTRVTVPGKLAERAREIAAGRLSAAVPRDAATIVLLRQGSGVEAYLLRRTRALDFAPGACVFLDDLGVNLKPARAMGMTTIKVETGPQAIAELEAATGMTLR